MNLREIIMVEITVREYHIKLEENILPCVIPGYGKRAAYAVPSQAAGRTANPFSRFGRGML
jgi:hypothetical protein